MKMSVSEVAEILTTAAQVLREYERISALPNCLTCHDKDCKYKPGDKDYVRINCPLWKGAKE